ncbi:hypothetical protein HYT23_02580 [Candidatus Pacearchaeota archaeon]|nr:hypothetical protein [Candidatus Pacearchaeota archaeon]
MKNKILLTVIVIVLIIVSFFAIYLLNKPDSIKSRNILFDGSLVVSEELESFQNAIAEIVLFEYDQNLADASADKFDSISLTISHQKGTENRLQFQFYENDKTINSERGYYVTTNIYREGIIKEPDRFLWGECTHGGFCKVLTENSPSHIEIVAKPINK